MTDAGFAEVARGLEDALQLARKEGKPTIAVLNLSRNDLTCRSLYELAFSIRLAGDDLNELDFSSNAIAVSSREDAHYLATFLDAIGLCRALKIINFNSNNLSGSRFWEVFTKAFTEQFRANDAALETLTDTLDTDTSDASDDMPTINSLSIRTTPSAPTSVDPVLGLAGLHSISCISLMDTSLTDAGALWLSFCVGRHKWLHDKLKTQQRSPISAHSKTGVCWTPNDKLSPIGVKVLKEAEATAFDHSDNILRVPENSPMVRNTSTDSGTPR